jgi:hypothetical protein
MNTTVAVMLVISLERFAIVNSTGLSRKRIKEFGVCAIISSPALMIINLKISEYALLSNKIPESLSETGNNAVIRKRPIQVVIKRIVKKIEFLFSTNSLS